MIFPDAAPTQRCADEERMEMLASWKKMQMTDKTSLMHARIKQATIKSQRGEVAQLGHM